MYALVLESDLRVAAAEGKGNEEGIEYGLSLLAYSITFVLRSASWGMTADYPIILSELYHCNAIRRRKCRPILIMHDSMVIGL